LPRAEASAFIGSLAARTPGIAAAIALEQSRAAP
jgi:hypothetical protein